VGPTLSTGQFVSPLKPRRGRFFRPPTTGAGRRALMLLAVAVAAWAVMTAAVAAGVRGDSAVPLQVVFLFVPNVVGLLSVLAGLVNAVLALIRGDRSPAIALPMLIGAFALMFVIGELAVPH